MSTNFPTRNDWRRRTMRKRERPWNYWMYQNKFYRHTEMRGFGLINAARSKYEKVFWYILIIVFTIVMTHDVIVLAQQWREKRTVTSMKMVHNTSVYLPDTTLCIKAELPDFNQYMGTTYLEREYTLDYIWMPQLKKSLSDYKNKEEFLNSSNRWDYIFIPLANRYFSFYFFAETIDAKHYHFKGEIDLINNKPPAQDSYFRAHMSYSFPMGSATDKFITEVRKLGVTDFELIDKFKIELLHLLEVGIVRYYGQSHIDLLPLLSSRLSWTDGKTFCFVFAFDRTEFLVDEHDLIIGANLVNLYTLYSPGYGNNTPGTSRVELGEKPLEDAEIQLFLNANVPLNKYPELETEIGSHKEAVVEFTGVYHSMKDCDPIYTESQCKALCRVFLVHRLCNCIPFFWAHNYMHHKDVCDQEIYPHCLNYSMQDDQPCRQACIPGCDMVIPWIETKRHRKPSEPMNHTWYKYRMVFTLSFPVSVYPEFQEEPYATWQNFIGDFGGIIDFWLGASFIGLIHMVFYLVKQIFYAFDRRTNTGENLRNILASFPQLPMVPGDNRPVCDNCQDYLDSDNDDDEMTMYADCMDEDRDDGVATGENVRKASDLVEPRNVSVFWGTPPQSPT